MTGATPTNIAAEHVRRTFTVAAKSINKAPQNHRPLTQELSPSCLRFYFEFNELLFITRKLHFFILHFNFVWLLVVFVDV